MLRSWRRLGIFAWPQTYVVVERRSVGEAFIANMNRALKERTQYCDLFRTTAGLPLPAGALPHPSRPCITRGVGKMKLIVSPRDFRHPERSPSRTCDGRSRRTPRVSTPPRPPAPHCLKVKDCCEKLRTASRYRTVSGSFDSATRDEALRVAALRMTVQWVAER